MKYKIYSSQENLYEEAKKEILLNEYKNIGLASGNTMIVLYQKLVEAKKKWENKNLFLLDEFYKLSKDHPGSFHFYINKHFLKKIENYNFYSFNAEADDSQKECEDYERLIQIKGGIDLQLLGLGSNGHIAFNEPGSGPESRCRLVDLSQQTIKVNKNNFEGEENLPSKALSLGIANIIESKNILLVATGQSKALAVKKLLEEKETSEWPCSYLQRHSNVMVFLDQEAASLLTTKT